MERACDNKKKFRRSLLNVCTLLLILVYKESPIKKIKLTQKHFNIERAKIFDSLNTFVMMFNFDFINNINQIVLKEILLLEQNEFLLIINKSK